MKYDAPFIKSKSKYWKASDKCSTDCSTLFSSPVINVIIPVIFFLLASSGMLLGSCRWCAPRSSITRLGKGVCHWHCIKPACFFLLTLQTTEALFEDLQSTVSSATCRIWPRSAWILIPEADKSLRVSPKMKVYHCINSFHRKEID